VEVRLNTCATAEELASAGYDAVIVATGILPRKITIPGYDHPSVLTYLDVLARKAQVGKRVAIIGAGGIGFDVAVYLTHETSDDSLDREAFLANWGIDTSLHQPGGLAPDGGRPPVIDRQVYLLQRKGSKVGAGLSKTTGWIHRAQLRKKQVTMLNAVSYERIDDLGLHIMRRDKKMSLDVDNVIVCAGQEPLRTLADDLERRGIPVHVIGGADVAAELDAKRAIDQGARLAAKI
jgi:2,4-dienoyl-CoA reductase (NADPH2)